MTKFLKMTILVNLEKVTQIHLNRHYYIFAINLPSQTFLGTFDFTYVTKFWKITHMGVREIIRIFMFGGLLL